MKKKPIIVFLSSIGILLLIGVAILATNNKEEESKVPNVSILSGLGATIYKSPTCGCCVGYAGKAKDQDISVEIVTNMEEALAIKVEHNIPREMQSCHTMMIEGYFVEGHVPFEAIEKLLSERPDIDGIALPGMPAGSPGMPGIKFGPYEVYQLKDGIYSHYISI